HFLYCHPFALPPAPLIADFSKWQAHDLPSRRKSEQQLPNPAPEPLPAARCQPCPLTAFGTALLPSLRLSKTKRTPTKRKPSCAKCHSNKGKLACPHAADRCPAG